MEYNSYLNEMGEKIRKIRKSRNLTQIAFYKKLYPENAYLQDENIKKKMNALENGKYKKVDFNIIFRIKNVFDVSLDYLFGYETEYPSYENMAASQYTGLSIGAIEQLRFWKVQKDSTIPNPQLDMTDKDFRELAEKKSRQSEAKWVLSITSKLLERKNDADSKSGITDLSVLYDIYMLTLYAPKTISGITEEIANSDLSLLEKAHNAVKISSDNIYFTDQMGEIHHIDIGIVNEQIWKNRLLKDLDVFIENIRKNYQVCNDCL